MLRVFAMVFKRFSGVFYKCFRHMFQVFYLSSSVRSGVASLSSSSAALHPSQTREEARGHGGADARARFSLPLRVGSASFTFLFFFIYAGW
jgi:hypothetical protein